MPTALVTGGSAGLGRALAAALAGAGWRVVVDARDADALDRAAAEIGGDVHAVAGDVTDPEHRAALVTAVAGRLDLLVNNASTLGASPLLRLADLPADALDHAWQTNVVAPFALIQAFLPALRSSRGVVLNVSSDASVEHYETWGGYGAAKAALDHLTGTLAAEEPEIRAYAVDPGDMRTGLHQQAFPGEDISDRPLPESVVPALLALLSERPASGRYRAAEIGVETAVPVASP